jgi:hypothetical protein
MRFQSVVLLLASVVLIGGLTYVGYMFNKLVRARQWPPAISRCPDYFEIVADQDDQGNPVCVDTRGVDKNVPYCADASGNTICSGDECTQDVDCPDTVDGTKTGYTWHEYRKVAPLSASLVRNLPDTERERIRDDMRDAGLTWDGITN